MNGKGGERGKGGGGHCYAQIKDYTVQRSSNFTSQESDTHLSSKFILGGGH